MHGMASIGCPDSVLLLITGIEAHGGPFPSPQPLACNEMIYGSLHFVPNILYSTYPARALVASGAPVGLERADALNHAECENVSTDIPPCCSLSSLLHVRYRLLRFPNAE